MLDGLSKFQGDGSDAQLYSSLEKQGNSGVVSIDVASDGVCDNRTLESLPDTQSENEIDQSYFSEICDSFNSLSFSSNDSKQNDVHCKKIVRPEVFDQVAKCVKKSLKYNEPSTSIESTLKILNEVPGSRFHLPHTKYKFRQAIGPPIDIEMHYRCQRCGFCTGIPKSSATKTELDCSHCNCTISKTADNFFMYIPLKQQLVESIRRNWESIVLFKQIKREENFISDIHDGYILKKIESEFRHSFNLSLTLNTDGAKVFQSSTKALWPMQLIQNYLHPRIRFLSTNIIVVGLWFGDGKPDVSTYFFPLIKELRKIHESGGFKIETLSSDITFLPFITHCTCDLPAKASCQGLKQYNAQYGCGYCKHPGVPLKNEAKTATTYRYVRQKVTDELRTHTDSLVALARLKKSTDSCIDGFTKVSPLIASPQFDIINGFPIDYMHCVLIGVTPKLISLWYDKKNKGAAYYINTKKKNILNQRITSIKPPSVINRNPRTLKDKEHFKANEWRSFLLYYLRFSLSGLLNQCYIEHFQLLSAATFMLSKKKIHVNEVEKAGQMLVRFVNEFESLYGQKNVTMNIHLLRHLADAVKNSGPLWSHSMFAFEQSNGELVKSVKAYTKVLHQISEKYSMRCCLKSEKEPFINFIFSNAVKVNPTETEKKLFEKYCIKSDEGLTFHKSIKIRGEMYTSLIYRKTKRIDYFSAFSSNQIGKIRYYIKYNESKYALVELYDVFKENFHLQEVVPKQSIELFKIAEIKEKLIYMEIGSRKIVCNIPNNFEKT